MSNRPLKYAAAPIGGRDISTTPTALLPALSALRACRDSYDTKKAIDDIPAFLIPPLIDHVTRRNIVSRQTIRELVTHAGLPSLSKHFGPDVAANIAERFGV